MPAPNPDTSAAPVANAPLNNVPPIPTVPAPVLPTRTAPTITRKPTDTFDITKAANGNAQTAETMDGASPSSAQSLAAEKGMTTDEIDLYDRQIRLWGMTAQKRLATTRVLMINSGPLAQEILKNLALAGVASIHISDTTVNTPASFSSSVLNTDRSHDKQPRAIGSVTALQSLNPRVKVSWSGVPIKTWDTTFVKDYDVVIATELPPKELTIVNTMSRLNHVPFYAADDYGMYGYMFADLIEHEYVLKRDAGNITPKVGPETRTRSITNVRVAREEGKPVEYITKRELYSTWMYASGLGSLPTNVLSIPRRKRQIPRILPYIHALWKYLDDYNGTYPTTKPEISGWITEVAKSRSLLNLDPVPNTTDEASAIASFIFNVQASIPPVVAVMGGQLAQDVINMRSGTQPVMQNVVVFDGVESKAAMYAIHPAGELGQKQLRSADLEDALRLAEAVSIKTGVP